MNHVSFKNFVLDQLRDIPDLQCRPLLSGYALCSDGRIFGIICHARVYFKAANIPVSTYADEEKSFARASKRDTLKNYYEVPPFVLEDHENLTGWAMKAMNLEPSNSLGQR